MDITKPEDEDVARILKEAENIRGTDSAPGASPPGASGEGPGQDSSPAPVSPSPSHVELARLAVVLVDIGCMRLFGPVGVMQEPLRSEAVQAWAAVFERYAPMVKELGPLGTLVAIYGAHLIGCASRQWMFAPSPSSAGGADLERPPS